MIIDRKNQLKKYFKKRSGKMQIFLKGTVVLLVFLNIFCYGSLKTYAMDSENYKIPKDSINIGGTEDGSSENYDLKDTIGEVGSGLGTSESYDLNAGFRPQAKKPLLRFSISTNSVYLGTLSKASVSSGNVITTVSTNAFGGYTTSVVADGNLRMSLSDIIPDVVDGSVTAGSSEYGISTSGLDGLFNATDTSVTVVSKDVASNANSVDGVNTTINFKASISGNESPGLYSQKVTIICTGNF